MVCAFQPVLLFIHRLLFDSCRYRKHCIDLRFESGLPLQDFFAFLLCRRSRHLRLVTRLLSCLPRPADFIGHRIQTRLQHSRFQLTLPHRDNMPSQSLQMRCCHFIAMPVPRYLHLPELYIRLRSRSIPAPFMAVPETSVHHNHYPILRQHNIRSSRQYPVLRPKPESTGMQSPPHQNLRLGILPSNTGHAATALVWGKMVHYYKPKPFL